MRIMKYPTWVKLEERRMKEFYFNNYLIVSIILLQYLPMVKGAQRELANWFGRVLTIVNVNKRLITLIETKEIIH
jgi:hypothetical protein